MKTVVPMTLERLRALLEAYGADPERWPSEEREPARALLAETPEAQRWRDASARLDAVLDRAPTRRVSKALTARILAAVPEPTASPTPAGGVHRLTERVRMRSLVRVAIPLAAAAALLLWISLPPLTRPPHGPDLENSALAAARIYDAPTDALLDVTSLRDLDRVPIFGCTGAGLDCLGSSSLQDPSQPTANSEM